MSSPGSVSSHKGTPIASFRRLKSPHFGRKEVNEEEWLLNPFAHLLSRFPTYVWNICCLLLILTICFFSVAARGIPPNVCIFERPSTRQVRTRSRNTPTRSITKRRHVRIRSFDAALSLKRKEVLVQTSFKEPEFRLSFAALFLRETSGSAVPNRDTHHQFRSYCCFWGWK